MSRSTIFRIRLDLSDVDRNVYAALNLTVVQHPSETVERLVLRVLAFALCYQEDLAFTKGISSGDEPDLWLRDPDGRVRLWGEVGLPEAARLMHAAPHTEQLFLLAGGGKMRRWQELNLSALEAIGNLAAYSLDWPWVQALAASLPRSAQWQLTVSDGVLYLNDGERDTSTELVPLAGNTERKPA